MKNWKKLSAQALVITGCLSSVPITCNSLFAKRSDDGYEYVTVTGSDIPKRVKIGDQVGTDSPVGTMSVEEFDKARQQLQNPYHPN